MLLHFSCSICNKSLNSQDYLATHIETVHNKVAQIGKVLKYPCPKCDRTFSSERRLANHLSKHDTDQLEHSCQICDKRQVPFAVATMQQSKFRGYCRKTRRFFILYMKFNQNSVRKPLTKSL